MSFSTLTDSAKALDPHVKAIAREHGHRARRLGSLRSLGPNNMGGYKLTNAQGDLVAGESYSFDAAKVFQFYGEPLPEVHS